MLLADLRSNGELKQTPKATSGDATLSGHKQPSALTLPIAYNSPRSVSPIPVSQSSFSPSVAVAPSPIGSFSSTSTSTSNSLSCQVSHMASTSYLPGPDLAPRKRPVILLQSVPHIIYQLPEHIIEADAAYFNKAVQFARGDIH
ncbi:unnamed protein product [Protopolystoma xenopodis]|uniref:Uncharacterized protein n=1 Tax=Protopolystoma xenopodis TaxID=117903 RepID=A0A3S5FBK9_9PLAT|nr:unnamed protein product [Protopolystoma xenopodis]